MLDDWIVVTTQAGSDILILQSEELTPFIFRELLPINMKREKTLNRKMGKGYEERSAANTKNKSTFQHVTSVEMLDVLLQTAW